MPLGTSAYEKRGIAEQVPEWDNKACTECMDCVVVCPHAAVRPVMIRSAVTTWRVIQLLYWRFWLLSPADEKAAKDSNKLSDSWLAKWSFWKTLNALFTADFTGWLARRCVATRSRTSASRSLHTIAPAAASVLRLAPTTLSTSSPSPRWSSEKPRTGTSARPSPTCMASRSGQCHVCVLQIISNNVFLSC